MVVFPLYYPIGMASGTSFMVSVDVVKRHRNTGLKWVDVAKILNTTPKTLRIWRQNNDYKVKTFFIF